MEHPFSLSLVLALLLSGAVAADAKLDTTARDGEKLLFAKIGEQSITQGEFNQAFTRAMQKRYYHGKPPEDQVNLVRQEVADEIISRALLLQEAKRLGFAADLKVIQGTLDSYDQRYADSPRWKAQRDSLLSVLRQRLEEEDLLKQLENKVREVTAPSQTQLSTYYHDNPEKFTEPARQRVSVILIGVDPSSPADVWDAAMTDAGDLAFRLREGADFAEVAGQHSTDRSSRQGGDMGYLHDGMLSPAAQAVVNELTIGAISEPVRLLEGVAVFSVSARTPASLRPYDEVKKRVRDLWLREQSDRTWLAFKQQLRSSTPISVYNETAPAALE